MYIIQQLTPSDARHHKVETVSLSESGIVVQVTTTYFGNTAATNVGTAFPQQIQVPAIPLSADYKQSVAEWLVSAEGPYAGGQIVSDADYAFVSVKSELLRKTKAKRDSTRDGGAQTPFGPVDTDINSRLNISGSVTMAGLLGAEFATAWRMSDNSLVQLDATQMTQLGMLVGQFVAACQTRKNEIDAAIEACTNLIELEAIDVNAGWPV